MAAALKPELFKERYASVFDGDQEWRELAVPEGDRYAWDSKSTYIQEPPFFRGLGPEPAPPGDIIGARVLASLGDSVTTDHISPAGAIPKNGPAARYLREQGVEQADWNTFGARRGNHEVMMRGTFGNVRIRNRLVPDKEGNWTAHLPSGEVMSIYDAPRKYIPQAGPLLAVAGRPPRGRGDFSPRGGDELPRGAGRAAGGAGQGPGRRAPPGDLLHRGVVD